MGEANVSNRSSSGRAGWRIVERGERIGVGGGGRGGDRGEEAGVTG